MSEPLTLPCSECAMEVALLYGCTCCGKSLCPKCHTRHPVKCYKALTAERDALREELKRAKDDVDRLREQYIIIRKGWDEGKIIAANPNDKHFWKVNIRTVPFRSPSERAVAEIKRLSEELAAARETIAALGGDPLPPRKPSEFDAELAAERVTVTGPYPDLEGSAK